MKSGGRKVFVAMSGGVDSSVAALLLKNQDYDVVGVFMRCWGGGSPSTALGITHSPGLGASCAEQDAEDARRVAEKLDIPFYVWDFEEEYKRKVVDYMIEGYRRGETPNPDVMCNREIKFGLFLNRALEMGADYVATGHYVQLAPTDPSFGTAVRPTPAAGRPLPLTPTTPRQTRRSSSLGFRELPQEGSVGNVSEEKEYISLYQAKDANKDQSYFLWTLTQEQLKHCLFPIGDYLKTEVREIARKAGLPTADKKDSQGICFLGQVRLDEFLAQYIKPKKGEVRLLQNNGSQKTVGEHRGAHFYTVGQRRGFGGGGGTPYYVAEKNVKANTLIVAPSPTDGSLYRGEVTLKDINFISPRLMTSNKITDDGIPVLARVRYRQPLSPARLFVSGDKSSVISHTLIFERPQKFVAAGQSAVFYSQDGEMLGGGTIKTTK